MPRPPRAPVPRAGARALALACLALAWVCLALAAPCRAEEPGGVPDSATATVVFDSTQLVRAVDYLWVVRTSLTTRRDVERVVERASALGVRGLLVQVVGRGDAFYRSDLLPRSEALKEPGLDPLGTLLPLAHAAGLEVHAWVNCMLVWSAPQPPRDPRHVVRAHPEWVARLADGRSMARLGRRELERRHLEGVFLAPGHPGVRRWLAAIAEEIVTRYPVDGVQLDYIRLPAAPTGFDPTTRARFALETGIDVGRNAAGPVRERARAESLWTEFQARELAATVREIRETVARVRPLTFSAAVLADTLSARRVHAQRWWEWLREGFLDRAFVMNYAPVVQTVMQQLLAYREAGFFREHIVPGIAVYNTPASAAATKILGARALGYREIALYSYDALYQKPGLEARLFQTLKSVPATPGTVQEAH